jgi:hypothetical protein
MTSPRRLEQDLPALLADLYLAGTPDYRDDLLRRTARTRQRHAWTFPERWLPMDIATRSASTPAFPWRQIGVVALLGLLIAAAAAVYVGSQPRLADPFGLAANGELAFIRDGDVVVRSTVDGSTRSLLTSPETETFALHSPRGDRLAVLRETTAGEEIWVGTANGGDMTMIGGPYQQLWLEWSPDQTQLAVAHVVNGLPTMELVGADGSGSRRVVDMPAEAPTFRPPDGKQLVFRGQEDGVWGYYLVDVAGGDPMRLAIEGMGLDGGDYDLGAPTWSPTGYQLAFHTLIPLPQSQGRTPGFRITVASIALDGTVTELRPLEFDPFSDDELNPVFTADGQSLIFQQRFGLLGQTDYTVAAWIAPADGGPATALGVESRNGDGIGFAPSPDGRSIFVHLFGEAQDWVADSAVGAPSLTDIASSSGVSWQRRAP